MQLDASQGSRLRFSRLSSSEADREKLLEELRSVERRRTPVFTEFVSRRLAAYVTLLAGLRCGTKQPASNLSQVMMAAGPRNQKLARQLIELAGFLIQQFSAAKSTPESNRNHSGAKLSALQRRLLAIGRNKPPSKPATSVAGTAPQPPHAPAPPGRSSAAGIRSGSRVLPRRWPEASRDKGRARRAPDWRCCLRRAAPRSIRQGSRRL